MKILLILLLFIISSYCNLDDYDGGIVIYGYESTEIDVCDCMCMYINLESKEAINAKLYRNDELIFTCDNTVYCKMSDSSWFFDNVYKVKVSNSFPTNYTDTNSVYYKRGTWCFLRIIYIILFCIFSLAVIVSLVCCISFPCIYSEEIKNWINKKKLQKRLENNNS